MAQQLRNRLHTVFSDAPWQRIAARQAQWPQNGTGRRINDIRAMVVHETSGWPPRGNGENMFDVAFLPGAGHAHTGETTQLYISGDGTVLLGMELPRQSHHATFVNGHAIGAETGHGWGNYRGTAHLGPWTTTDETMVPNPNKPGTQMPGPTNGRLIPLRAKPGNRWLPLSGDGTMESDPDDDLPGLKFYVRHQSFNEVALGVWTTPRYAGPWRQPMRAPEMVFTEQQYRAWALLARWVAERYLLPRNFSLYPWKNRSGGFGDGGVSHGMIDDAARFRELVLADEGLSRSPQTFGLPAGTVPPTAASLEQAYTAGVRAAIPATKTPPQAFVPRRNDHWRALFNVYRGFHGHGYSGDPSRGNDHDCPGPMFDWHRFARETWDWWWWPFDLDAATPNAAAAARPYSLATRDGNTPLKEHFWGTPVATLRGRVRTGIHGPTGSPQTFELPQRSRVYAMANGELVAARFPAEGAGVSLAWVLVRHEVFHQLDRRAPNPAATPPVFANRIDYDVAPSTVYSLYMHLGRPTGMSFERVVPENPDWLNRVLARKKEAELGVAFRASATGQAIPVAKWNNAPPGSSPRPTLAAGWAADDTAYTTFLQRLRSGQVATAPRQPDTTAVRILLGDYLAQVGGIGAGRSGVRVEVFATTVTSPVDFAPTDTTSTTNDWTPGAGVGEPVVQYRSEWARTPVDEEALGLTLAGVADVSLVNWWSDVQPATLDRRLPHDAHLDPFGAVHHYDPLTFLPWINARTWRSEWPKYRVSDPAGVPAAPRPR